MSPNANEFRVTFSTPGQPDEARGIGRRAPFDALRTAIADWTPFWRGRFVPLFRRHMLESFVSEGANTGGRWAALSPAYALWKRKHAPGKGLLVLSGAMKAQLTSEAPGAVFRPSATALEIGSSVPYARFHQTGTRKMPARPPIRLTPAFLDQVGREMNQHVEDVIKGRLDASGMRVSPSMRKAMR